MKQFWQENKGSISTLAALSIIAVLMILFLSVNISTIFATKARIEDASVSMSEIILQDQLSNPDPNPTALIQTLDDRLQLQESLNNLTYQYQFGYSLDGVTFIPLEISNPTPADFYTASGMDENTRPALAMEIRTPMINIGSLLRFSGTITGKHITYTDPTLNSTNNDPMNCYCQAYCADKLIPLICMPPCLFFTTMLSMMQSMMSLDSDAFSSALSCLFSDMVFVMSSMAETAWNAGEWAWTTASTTINLSS